MRGVGTRGPDDLNVSPEEQGQPLHFCGLRWKFETIRKGRKVTETRKKKQGNNKMLPSCRRQAGR